MADDTQFNIQEMAQWLEMRKMGRYPTVLFLGARSGGLFRSSAFFNTMEGFSTRSFANLSHRERFAECYQILNGLRSSEAELDNILNRFLQDVELTDADVCLADLARQEFFDVIITTNVDDLLGQAFQQVDWRERRDFDVIIPGHGPDLEMSFVERKVFCRVIKPFGDLTSRIYTITNRSTYLDKHPKFKARLEDLLAKDILVVGLDPTWDEEIIRSFLPKSTSLWFVGEDAPTNHVLTARLIQGRQVKYIAGKAGEYEIFFKALYWHLIKGVPINFQLTRDIMNRLQAIANEQRGLHNEIRQALKEQQEILHKEIENLRKELRRLLSPSEEE